MRELRVNPGWFYVLLAVLGEFLWVTGLAHAYNVLTWILTFSAIALSFFGLIKAGNHLPVGTAYAVFVGLGTSVITIIDVFVFKQNINFIEIACIVAILGATIGLKQLTDADEAHLPNQPTNKGDA